jgi:hypothetical protein
VSHSACNPRTGLRRLRSINSMKGRSAMNQKPRVLVRRTLARAWWLPLSAAILAVASCASSVTNPSTFPRITQADTTASSSGVVGTDRLTATVTYQGGQERFDPPPRDYQPQIDAAQAFAAFAKSVDPSSLGTNEKPTILLASYTNFTTGKQATFVTGTMDPIAAASSDEGSKPWWTAVPVWYIRYLHVPIAPAGAPAAPAQTKQSPVVVIQEMVIPVSAETGQVLMMENTSADQAPTSWPPQTGGNGDATKASGVRVHQQPTSAQTTTTH